MPRDRFIDESMWQCIDRELGTIEHEHCVRVLLAVESGSRAWRFPSPDSDYDVRFIYVHSADAYLSIEPPRDVIDRPSDGVLDINGWDIRKALQLLVRSNAVLLEWLTSPVRYWDGGGVPLALLKLARETCHLPALVYHYDRLARHSFDDILSASGRVHLKTYCYALRPTLALSWIRRNGTPPPMDLPKLLDGVAVAEDVRKASEALVTRKAKAVEQDIVPQIPELDAFIAETLTERASRVRLPDRSAVLSQANALFATILHDTSAC